MEQAEIILKLSSIVIFICAGLIAYEAWKRGQWIKELKQEGQEREEEKGRSKTKGNQESQRES
jgi:predicted transposase YdaD